MNKILFRAVFFSLSVLSLCSCRQYDETDKGNESGDLVAVNILIEGVKVESVDSPLTRGSSADTLTVTEELEDGLVLETSLLPISAGLTRALTTTALENNVQILAIAYRERGELYKYQYFTPSSPIIHLPKGERFKLVFYSYNSSIRPNISNDITGSVSSGENGFLFSKTASLNNKTEEYTNNVMWGKIDLTPEIISGVKLAGVTFTHLFSRLEWTLNSVVGNITSCQGSVRNTYKNGNIKLGNLVNVINASNSNDTWEGVGSANYVTPVTFTTVGSQKITSSKTVFCPNAGQKIVLGLEKITVDGKTFENKRYTFPTILKRGVNYTVHSTIKRAKTVTFTAARGGSVSPLGDQSVENYGDFVYSTATPKSGWKFEGWYRIGENVQKETSTTGDVAVSDKRIKVRVNQNTANLKFEARFIGPKIEFAPSILRFTDGKWSFSDVGYHGWQTPRSSWGINFLRGQSQPYSEGKRQTPTTWRLQTDPCRKMGDGWMMPTAEMLGNGTWIYDGAVVAVTFDSKMVRGKVLFPRLGMINNDLNGVAWDYALQTNQVLARYWINSRDFDGPYYYYFKANNQVIKMESVKNNTWNPPMMIRCVRYTD